MDIAESGISLLKTKSNANKLCIFSQNLFEWFVIKQFYFDRSLLLVNLWDDFPPILISGGEFIAAANAKE